MFLKGRIILIVHLVVGLEEIQPEAAELLKEFRNKMEKGSKSGRAFSSLCPCRDERRDGTKNPLLRRDVFL